MYLWVTVLSDPVLGVRGDGLSERRVLDEVAELGLKILWLVKEHAGLAVYNVSLEGANALCKCSSGLPTRGALSHANRSAAAVELAVVQWGKVDVVAQHTHAKDVTLVIYPPNNYRALWNELLQEPPVGTAE